MLIFAEFPKLLNTNGGFVKMSKENELITVVKVKRAYNRKPLTLQQRVKKLLKKTVKAIKKYVQKKAKKVKRLLLR